MPDLSGYQQTPVDPFLDSAAAGGGEVYFQTPDGLLCGIRPAQGMAGCDGALPGAPPQANEIVLAADPPARGFRATSGPRFVKPSGGAAPVLSAGRKITFADFECAVGTDTTKPTTMCTKGFPPSQWMVIGPSVTGVGPRTAGLPVDFPDPNDFALSDQSYLVGGGGANAFAVFTAGGLTCRIAMSTGGEIVCDAGRSAHLPGRGSDNEVFAQVPGPVGTRQAGDQSVTVPAYPGAVKELPPGHRIDAFGGTCMAPRDGGVACFGVAGVAPQGFRVTADSTTTFGGS
ncbi:MAG TPA: hypothetical protein VFW21_03765 [Mycobacterium sp.]|nr:hypothetical protein [Mycobacterium sp.]